jgi:hypothetical protein
VQAEIVRRILRAGIQDGGCSRPLMTRLRELEAEQDD